MKTNRLLIFAVVLFCSAFAKAEELPSLKGLGNPVFNEEKGVNTTFPTYLERQGDVQSAILEWQRIAYEAFTEKERAKAQMESARLFILSGKYTQAQGVLVRIGEEKGSKSFIPKALYYMSVLSDLQKNFQESNIYRKRLQKLYPKSHYIEEAERHTLWALGLNAKEKFPEVTSKKAKELKEKLEKTPALNASKAHGATVLSLLPGLGHLYLGDWRTAFMAFFFNMILIVAFVSALSRKHYAYSTFFGLMVSIVYVGTLFSAHTLAQRTTFENRLKEMETWQDLRPTFMHDIVPVHLSSLHPVEAPLWVYRNVMSTFDGERSNAYPVNSSYAKQAMHKHGVMLGSLFMVDRLLRDWREIENPLAEYREHGRIYYVDPLSRNDFWLKA